MKWKLGAIIIPGSNDASIAKAIELLNAHYESFHDMVELSRQTGHPVPTDTRGWSQILASVLTGIDGLFRKKGADLKDGSDVKGANTWEAIDTPRFNGVIKAGTKSATSGTVDSLTGMPYLFLVLWDTAPGRNSARCRVWCVQPSADPLFREIAKTWYDKREAGEIQSNNFQLHPPRGQDSDVIRNTCGNLEYPLLFSAERARDSDTYVVSHYDPEVMNAGRCALVGP